VVTSGNASTAAMLSRRGVSTAIVSRDGTTRRILLTELLNADEALFAPVFLLIGDVIDRQEQMLYVVKIEPTPRKPFQVVLNPL
jgi:hypothetical protein